jgi:hypothetical protein
MLVGSLMGWFLDNKNNLRRENAATHPSMIAKGAVTSTEEDYIERLRSENTRLLAEHKTLMDNKNLHTLALENEVLAAIIDGHLFKERLLEIVKIVLFTELDTFLDNRFTKGSKYPDERVAEAKAELGTLNNSPEENHGK